MFDYNTLLSQILNNFYYEDVNPQQLKIIRKIAQMNKPHGILMLNSPTGSGKTAASLTSLLTRKQLNEKIVVFVRTISQMEPILREWARIIGGYEGLKDLSTPRILPLLGKARLCKLLPHLKKHSNFPDVGVNILCKSTNCELYPGNENYKRQGRSNRWYLDKINFSLAGQSKFQIPTINKVVETYNNQPNCGYFEQKSMIRHASIVIATYAFLKEPLFSNLLKNMGVKLENTLFLIDEAHNLEKPGRIELTEDAIIYVRSIFGKIPLLDTLQELMTSKGKYEAIDIAPDEEWLHLQWLLSEMDKREREKRFISLEDLVHPKALELLNFIQSRNIGFIRADRGELRIIQATPSRILAVLKNASFTIFQSGTLEPLDEFAKLFNMPEAVKLNTKTKNLPSNKFGCYFSGMGLTSAQKHRNIKLYIKMVDIIIELYKISPRHVLVICPSYEFKEQIYNFLINYERDNWIGELYYKNSKPESRIINEERGMDTAKIVSMLGRKDKKIVVAVSNGKFSEGIEVVYKNNSLLSMTIFAGLPFIPPSTDSLIFKKARLGIAGNRNSVKLFEQNIPISMMVQQAFGRTTRSINDKGAMIILDYRAQRYLHNALHLRKYQIKQQMLEDIQTFFNGYPKLSEL